MKVLVTGATGLLGSRLLRALPEDWQVVGTFHSHPVEGMLECHLSNGSSVVRLVQKGRRDWIVHCAAIRSPDACKADPRRAFEVNAMGTETMARASSDAGARLAYASSDYVFPGDKPPYREEDRPAPVNAYGQSKLAGEEHALAVPGSLVVRMPVLYSYDLGAPHNVLTGLRDALSRGEQVPADNDQVRYFTLAEEAAAAFAFLMQKGQRGVVHVSAEEPCTKREFFQAAARAMGLDEGLVVEAKPDPSSAVRPHDSHLDTGLYRSLGGPAFTGYRAALQCLTGV